MCHFLLLLLQVVDGHGGFKRLAAWVKADQRQTLTWFITLLTFFMSAVLDNLTTTVSAHVYQRHQQSLHTCLCFGRRTRREAFEALCRNMLLASSMY